jgi:hypothetical protein
LPGKTRKSVRAILEAVDNALTGTIAPEDSAPDDLVPTRRCFGDHSTFTVN